MMVAAEIHDQVRRNLAEESRGGGALLLATAKAPPVPRPREDQALLRARHADIAEPALFFHHGLGVEGAAVGKEPFFQTCEEHEWKFEAFGVVQSKQIYLGALVHG